MKTEGILVVGGVVLGGLFLISLLSKSAAANAAAAQNEAGLDSGYYPPTTSPLGDILNNGAIGGIVSAFSGAFGSGSANNEPGLNDPNDSEDD